MKALILVGGFGTRLRPLTINKPKPLVEFANKAMILHQVEALKKVGVTDIVLAINTKPDLMSASLAKFEKEYGVKFHFSIEVEPLGTAGPIALAADILKGTEPFFVLNADVSCEFRFQELLDFHKAHGKEGTIFVTKVEDPSKFGVVLYDEKNGKVNSFVEKPSTFVGDKINAGIYVLNPSILQRIKPVKTSIEREIFPAMVAQGQLFCLELKGFWADVGQPKDYMVGTSLFLGSLRKHNPEKLASEKLPNGSTIIGNVLIDSTAKIGSGCVIGPDVTIGPQCVIEDGVRLSKCTLLNGVVVKKSAFIINSIIGWSSSIGSWTRIENNAVLGEDVHVSNELYINGAQVLPHKEIKDNVTQPIVIM